MLNTALSHLDRSKSPTFARTRLVILVALVVWLALIFFFGAAQVLVTQRSTPPIALLIAVTTPVVIFLFAFGLSSVFREIVLGADLRLITGIQAWRFAGFGFLALYAHKVLPGFFAWPAGVGDMAIGITAPWIITALIREPEFAASKTFVVWNILGILDLIVAVGCGGLVPLLLNNGAISVPTTPMAQLPLVLIPAYLVPAFIILHLIALFQARRLSAYSSV